ncbi:signal peptidase I [soil metagenome]
MTDAAPPSDTPTQKSAMSGAANEAVEIVKTIVYALLIALVLRVILFQPFTIPSESMEPALLKGDYIIVSKYSYGWSRHSIPFSPPIARGRLMNRVPERGDIIVFKLPRDGRTDYIKRLIGLPGDRIQVTGGVVSVNGKQIPRVDMGPTQDPGMPAMRVEQFKETQPNGKTYITFDQSPDHEGDTTEVYIVPEGHYFFMGDNRDNSLDSRWPTETGVGFVPAENLVGKAQVILLSWKDGASLFKPWTWFTKAQPKRFFHRLK